jgi:hypothetical protein
MIAVKKISTGSVSITKYKNTREEEIFHLESIFNTGTRDLERDSPTSMSPGQRKSAN